MRLMRKKEALPLSNIRKKLIYDLIVDILTTQNIIKFTLSIRIIGLIILHFQNKSKSTKRTASPCKLFRHKLLNPKHLKLF